MSILVVSETAPSITYTVGQRNGTDCYTINSIEPGRTTIQMSNSEEDWEELFRFKEYSGKFVRKGDKYVKQKFSARLEDEIRAERQRRRKL